MYFWIKFILPKNHEEIIDFNYLRIMYYKR